MRFLRYPVQTVGNWFAAKRALAHQGVDPTLSSTEALKAWAKTAFPINAQTIVTSWDSANGSLSRHLESNRDSLVDAIQEKTSGLFSRISSIQAKRTAVATVESLIANAREREQVEARLSAEAINTRKAMLQRIAGFYKDIGTAQLRTSDQFYDHLQAQADLELNSFFALIRRDVSHHANTIEDLKKQIETLKSQPDAAENNQLLDQLRSMIAAEEAAITALQAKQRRIADQLYALQEDLTNKETWKHFENPTQIQNNASVVAQDQLLQNKAPDLAQWLYSQYDPAIAEAGTRLKAVDFSPVTVDFTTVKDYTGATHFADRAQTPRIGTLDSLFSASLQEAGLEELLATRATETPSYLKVPVAFKPASLWERFRDAQGKPFAPATDEKQRFAVQKAYSAAAQALNLELGEAAALQGKLKLNLGPEAQLETQQQLTASLHNIQDLSQFMMDLVDDAGCTSIRGSLAKKPGETKDTTTYGRSVQENAEKLLLIQRTAEIGLTGKDPAVSNLSDFDAADVKALAAYALKYGEPALSDTEKTALKEFEEATPKYTATLLSDEELKQLQAVSAYANRLGAKDDEAELKKLLKAFAATEAEKASINQIGDLADLQTRADAALKPLVDKCLTDQSNLRKETTATTTNPNPDNLYAAVANNKAELETALLQQKRLRQTLQKPFTATTNTNAFHDFHQLMKGQTDRISKQLENSDSFKKLVGRFVDDPTTLTTHQHPVNVALQTKYLLSPDAMKQADRLAKIDASITKLDATRPAPTPEDLNAARDLLRQSPLDVRFDQKDAAAVKTALEQRRTIEVLSFYQDNRLPITSDKKSDERVFQKLALLKSLESREPKSKLSTQEMAILTQDTGFATKIRIEQDCSDCGKTIQYLQKNLENTVTNCQRELPALAQDQRQFEALQRAQSRAQEIPKSEIRASSTQLRDGLNKRDSEYQAIAITRKVKMSAINTGSVGSLLVRANWQNAAGKEPSPAAVALALQQAEIKYGPDKVKLTRATAWDAFWTKAKKGDIIAATLDTGSEEELRRAIANGKKSEYLSQTIEGKIKEITQLTEKHNNHETLSADELKTLRDWEESIRPAYVTARVTDAANTASVTLDTAPRPGGSNP